MIDFKLPFLGEGIKSAGVVRVLVAVGATISAEQPVLEVETDKAAIEVPSSVSGKITKIHVAEGQKVDVGAIILTVDEKPSEARPSVGQVPAPKAEEVKSVSNTNAPETPSKSAEATGRSPVQRDASASMPPTAAQSSASGSPNHSAQPPAPREQSQPAAGPAVGEKLRETAPASPSVRRLAREIGVDVMQVPGSGPAGRISLDDVKVFARRANTDVGGFVSAINNAGAVALPDFAKWGPTEAKAMSSIRRKTAEHLGHAWATIPQVTQFDRADMTEIGQLRQHYGKKAEAAGSKLTVTAIVIKVVASALKVFPQFNASIDMERNEIIYKKYYHIGVAVDTDRGLLVPVIRNVDKKNIIEISGELNLVAEKARTKKTTLDEMQGGTFTITNLGGIGGTNFTPIVNSPEVAILGIARSTLEPVYIDGKFEPRSMLPLSLSYDHRVIDGADGARFLRWVVDALQQPFLMSLEG